MLIELHHIFEDCWFCEPVGQACEVILTARECSELIDGILVCFEGKLFHNLLSKNVSLHRLQSVFSLSSFCVSSQLYPLRLNWNSLLLFQLAILGAGNVQRSRHHQRQENGPHLAPCFLIIIKLYRHLYGIHIKTPWQIKRTHRGKLTTKLHKFKVR